MRARLARSLHRLHRALGGALGLLLFAWFASGAVMLFCDFPRLTERESLARAPALELVRSLVLGPGVSAWLASNPLLTGDALRLRMLEGRPTWLYRDATGRVRAERADTGRAVLPLDVARARRVVAQSGFGSVRGVEPLTEPDQWSVALFTRGGLFPLLRVELTDTAGTQLYLGQSTGELVQKSTRRERVAAWFGAIPHWIYPTLLRRHREGWRVTVLVLSALGLGVTLSGLIVGVHVRGVLRRSRAAAPRRLRDPLLRWHQTLGLGFGLFASTWLLSGALSLAPFRWADRSAPWRQVTRTVHAGSGAPAPAALEHAIAACGRALDLRELQVTRWGGALYAVCLDDRGATRLVALTPSPSPPRARLDRGALTRVVRALGSSAPASLVYGEDDYYYRTWRAPHITLPFVRAELPAGKTCVYLDPARARVLSLHTPQSRLERWLYHGLHSFDFGWLYRRRALWLAWMMGAMTLGAVLSGLGAVMMVRRGARRLRRWLRRRVRLPASWSRTWRPW